MPKLPRVKPQKVLSALLRAGFYAHHQSGSHINLRHKVKTYLHVILRSSLNPVFYCDFTGLAANNSELARLAEALAKRVKNK